MTTQTLLGHGVWLVGILIALFARPGAGRRQAVQHRAAVSTETSATACPIDRLPDHHTLAGQPLRVLLSDASGPGAVLRDTLLTRPPTYDP